MTKSSAGHDLCHADFYKRATEATIGYAPFDIAILYILHVLAHRRYITYDGRFHCFG